MEALLSDPHSGSAAQLARRPAMQTGALFSDLNSGSASEVALRLACVALVFLCLDIAAQVLLFARIKGLLRARNPQWGGKALDHTAVLTINKLVATVHNIIQVPLALVVLFDVHLAADRLHAQSQRSAAMVLFSAGYFAYDLAQALLRFHKEDASFLIHAGASTAVFMVPQYTHQLQWYGAAFLLWELSTPFVHGRWFLFKLGLEDTRLYLANGLAMTVTFFAARCVWGTYASVLFWMDTALELAHPRPDSMTVPVIYAFRVANIVLNSLNWYWFSKMAWKVVAILAGGRRASEVKGGKDY